MGSLQRPAKAHGGDGRAAGRRRDPSPEPRVVAAALAVYAEAGWSGFGFGAVARRARVGKAPQYLRWASKEDLLLAAFCAHTTAIAGTDSGNVRDDLVEYTCRLTDSKAGPGDWAFLRLHLEVTVIPALHGAFSSQIAGPHVQGARALLDRAPERGQIRPCVPAALVLDSLYGAVLIKIILAAPGERAALAKAPGLRRADRRRRAPRHARHGPGWPAGRHRPAADTFKILIVGRRDAGRRGGPVTWPGAGQKHPVPG
jgi:Tetracyclin repressor-like, C-terminal domain/Bacterial regulatory proteins, tetR family